MPLIRPRAHRTDFWRLSRLRPWLSLVFGLTLHVFRPRSYFDYSVENKSVGFSFQKARISAPEPLPASTGARPGFFPIHFDASLLGFAGQPALPKPFPLMR